MKSIGFFNNKGGVGKTTLLCNVAASIAKLYNAKVLVIDADPQCNASAYLLPEDELNDILLSGSHSSIDALYEPIRKGHGYLASLPTIVRSGRFNVDLIVGDPKLSIREDLLATDWASTRNGDPRGFQTTFAIKELLSRLDQYDFILVDMGPSLGALNRSVLLALDHFLMPLSVDIFSLMAVANILNSFSNWKSSLLDAIARHTSNEHEPFKVAGTEVGWSLKFAGYVMQQYSTKSTSGKREAVQAFERIITKQDVELIALCSFFGLDSEIGKLGDIPTLGSVVPLSQQAHAPIFDLGSKDGIVGSHYTRVSEATAFYNQVAAALVERIKE